MTEFVGVPLEIYAEFDLIDGGFADAYFYGETLDEIKERVIEELKVWGGGHADLFEDGEFIDDVEY